MSEKMQKTKPSGIEWIGDIPVEWKVKKLKYFADICNGAEYLDTELLEGGYPVMGSGGEFARVNKYHYDKPSVLFGRKGTVDNPLYIDEPFWCVDTMFYTHIYSDTFPKFLYYLATQIRFDYYLTATALPSMTQRDLKSDVLPCPPYKEQQTIASFLDTQCEKIDGIIADTEQQIEVLKQYKTSLITETVTKGLDKSVPMKDSGIEWIGKIPARWEVKRLKYILKTPLQYGANESGDDYDVSLPRYIRITDISLDNELKNEDKLSLPLNIAKPYLLNDGDILFARSGATVGKSFIFNKRYGQAAFAGYLIRAVCDIEKYFPKYIYYITLDTGYEQWLQMVFTQATIQNIGANRYENLIITSPPSTEQQTIASFLDDKCEKIDRLISDKQKSIETIKSYKKSLIYEYVTGKKRVKI